MTAHYSIPYGQSAPPLRTVSTLQHSVRTVSTTTTYGQHTTAFRTYSTVSTHHYVRSAHYSIPYLQYSQHTPLRTVSTLKHCVRTVSTRHYVQSASYSIPHGQSAHTTTYSQHSTAFRPSVSTLQHSL